MSSAFLTLANNLPFTEIHSDESHSLDVHWTLSDRLKWCVQAVLSFEMVVAVMVTLGSFKAKAFVERLQEFLSTDITIAVMGLAVLLFARTVLNFKQQMPAHAIDIAAAGGLFIGYILLSLLWTSSVDYASNKIVRVGGIVLPLMLFSAIAIAPDANRRKRVLFCLALIGTMLGADTIYTYLTSGRDFSFSEDVEANSVGLGVNLGVTITILFAYILLICRSMIVRLVVLAALLMLTWALLTTGARGPLLATVTAVGSLIVIGAMGTGGNRAISPQSIRNYGIIAIVIVVATTVFYVSYTGEAPRMLRRIAVLTQSQGGDAGGRSVGMRMTYWAEATRIAMEHPIFGGGVGSFPVLTGHADARLYPHNIVLETACELGFVGLLLLGVFAYAIRNAVFARDGSWNDPYRLVSLCLLINLITASMFSMDLGEQRMLAVVIGLQAGVSTFNDSAEATTHSETLGNPA